MSVCVKCCGKIWRHVISLLISYEYRNMEKVFVTLCKSCIYMQINCKTVQILFGDMQSVMTNDCIDIVHVCLLFKCLIIYITPSYLDIQGVPKGPQTIEGGLLL